MGNQSSDAKVRIYFEFNSRLIFEVSSYSKIKIEVTLTTYYIFVENFLLLDTVYSYNI